MELFDLTLPLHPGMSVCPGDPEVTFVRTCSHSTDGYEVTQLCLGTHSGTHIDAPRHFFLDGSTLDQFTLDRLVRPGVIVDCRPAGGGGSAPAAQAEAHIVETKVLAERLRFCPVPPGGFVLLWTEGAPLAADAGPLLLGTGASLVGIDAPSIDAEPHPVHKLLLQNEVLLAENLCGLSRPGTGLVTCAFLPLAVVGTDGAPVRAIVWR